MAFGNLFGSGGESNSLYGTSLTSGSIPAASSFIYFEWFIFKVSSSQPATPTGGSWDFLTNTGVPPTGWVSSYSGIPLDNMWFSIAFVDSRNPTGFSWSTPGLISAATSVYASAYADKFTGNGSTTAWTLSADPVTINNLDVSVNGVTQTPTTDYTISGTTFTTTTAAPLGSILLVKYRQALPTSYYGSSNNVSYTPAGTGAVTTTVQAKLRETVSVLDFGADPTGITDSYAAIQAALNANSSVYIPKGTYRITTELTLNSNQFLHGDGAASVIYSTGGAINNAINLVMAYEKTNIVVEGINVQATYYGNAFPTIGTFTGMGIPIGLVGCSYSVVRKSYVSKGGGYVSGQNQGSCGIYLSSSKYCRVLDNYVTDGQNGIVVDTWYAQLAGGSKAGFLNGRHIIANNHVWNMSGRGIALDDDVNGIGFNQFIGNNISQVALDSINVTVTKNLLVSNNSLDGTGTGRTQGSLPGVAAYYGMFISGSSNVTIADNVFNGSLFAAIFAYDPSYYKIVDNEISYTGNVGDFASIGAQGAICMLSTGSNTALRNKINNNNIRCENAATVKNITAISWAANVVTITTAAAHGYSAGQTIAVYGVTPVGYNGVYTIASAGTTTLTYALTTNPGASTVLGFFNGATSGILFQIGAATANHAETSVVGNTITGFGNPGFNHASVPNTPSYGFNVTDNVINSNPVTTGYGLFINGLKSSQFADNLLTGGGIFYSSYTTGYNRITGSVNGTITGMFVNGLNFDYVAIDFNNISGTAISILNTVPNGDMTKCTFNSIGRIKDTNVYGSGYATGALIEVYDTVVPTGIAGQIFSGGVGDRVINKNPVVGQPKSWVCTVAGTPGTWVSEGNL